SKLTAFKCDGIPECYDLSDECGGVCETEQAFCEFRKTFLQSTMLEYNCSNGIRIATNEICNGFWSRCEPRVEFEESQCPGRFKCKSGSLIVCSWFVSIDRSLVCNGYRNCDDGSDELNCKDRFYCTTGQRPTSVPTWFRFDDFSDCDDGSDECPPALKNSIISSRNEMISNGFLRAWLWIMAIIALSGNAYVICKTCLKYEKLKTCSAIAKGNYFLIFNLALSDFLMGVYLAVVAGYSVSFSGKYCFEDEGWRTGTTCAYLGALSVTSSEASLFILSVLTAMRLYTILFPWRSRNISLVQVLIAVIIAWAVAVTLAVLPLGAYFSEIVTEGAWLPSKFFNSTVVRLNQARTFTDQVGLYTRNSTPLVMYANGSVTWSSVRAYLNMYSPDNTIQGLYGYYSRSSVCLSKFFVRSNASGWQFAIVIVSVNFLLFLFIAGSYLVIYKHSNTTKPTKSTEKDRAAKMQSKIIKLVATDFTCWVPICIMSFMHFSRIVTITDTGYIVTAVVLLPINSVLNPLLYSNVFEKL
uniref:G-protein coupled receptors family 1 profile domain-containing protein n=1 Tax=Ciona intestinalis TaxID=7719 RepID=F7BKP7_CIOIN